MSVELLILLATAVSVGFIHTIVGPDHYLPFILLSKSRNWSVKKTVMITSLCGLGHIGSSAAIGFIALAVGIAAEKVALFNEVRGLSAAWLLLGFGLAYSVWGMKSALKNRPHRHAHDHADGHTHEHVHSHQRKHAHVHGLKLSGLWMFVIFVFGPCEALLPLIMVPGLQSNIPGVMLVIAAFSMATLLTMQVLILAGRYGFSLLRFQPLERHLHTLTGLTISLSAAGILFLGW